MDPCIEFQFIDLIIKPAEHHVRGYYLYLLVLGTTVTLIVNINLNEKKNKTLEAVGFEPERVDT